ncbi:hypothetical protein [Acetobacter vaccinii]|uniref:Uncharacterized protein n=1 Tax=Acetobacter vaccinii TaxID=2592655 RepID=A0A5C1YUN3_9PROT|nr:hypothetical protein [Acetobacter vaccinii]QEO18772.1 hypothetical protein FLP30_12880 [Acetobacter vaccinii]
MAAVSGLNTPPVSGGGNLPRPESESSYAALREAGQELMEIALQEGIDSHAPLGLWIRTLKGAMDAQALLCLAVSRETREANTVADSSLAARNEDLDIRQQIMQDLTVQLKQSLEAVRTLHLSTENRIKEHEGRLDQQYAQIVDKSVASVMKDLKREVFDALRQRLPLQEGAFYYMARWHFFMKLTLGILFFVLLGSGLTAVAGWHAYSRGVYCFGHTLRNEQGQAWCALDPLFNHTAERTETDQEK